MLLSTKTILHVIDTHGPGGGETVLLNLIEKFKSKNYRIVVIIKAKGWLYSSLLKIQGITIYFAKSSGSFNLQYLKTIIKIIKKEKIDLIHTHYLGPAVYSAIAGLITRKPVISTIHGAADISNNEKLSGLKYLIMNCGLKKVVAVSQGLKKEILLNTSIKKSRIDVIYNGTEFPTDNKGIAKLREEIGTPSSSKVVCSVGNIRPAKAYDVLLNVAEKVIQNDSNVEFWIVGEGDNKLHQELLIQQKKLGLVEKVKFLGFREDVSDLMRASDLFLLCSKSEGFSLSTIEAMAAKVPVIATRCGGPEEIIIDNETGFLVDNGDVSAIKNKVIETLKLSNTSMLESAFMRVKSKFSNNSMADSYETLYKRYL